MLRKKPCSNFTLLYDNKQFKYFMKIVLAQQGKKRCVEQAFEKTL